jgi:large subunit ribosomal protein L23
VIEGLRLEDAQKVVVRPYITERTFEQIERENKLCFIVADDASKTQIAKAVETLYEVTVTAVNTTRTLIGKKAFVRLDEESSAAELATKLGLV